ncbi:hypothetical protein HanIR_Chr13g0662721 [Helianthus annuus]|nr:hypothetical protein HanIR_Chr13g0662721 [Helianthus annuus]
MQVQIRTCWKRASPAPREGPPETGRVTRQASRHAKERVEPLAWRERHKSEKLFLFCCLMRCTCFKLLFKHRN